MCLCQYYLQILLFLTKLIYNSVKMRYNMFVKTFGFYAIICASNSLSLINNL